MFALEHFINFSFEYVNTLGCYFTSIFFVARWHKFEIILSWSSPVGVSLLCEILWNLPITLFAQIIKSATATKRGYFWDNISTQKITATNRVQKTTGYWLVRNGGKPFIDSGRNRKYQQSISLQKLLVYNTKSIGKYVGQVS